MNCYLPYTLLHESDKIYHSNNIKIPSLKVYFSGLLIIIHWFCPLGFKIFQKKGGSDFPQEPSLTASNQQIYNFYKWIIFEKKRYCGK